MHYIFAYHNNVIDANDQTANDIYVVTAEAKLPYFLTMLNVCPRLYFL